MIHVALPLLIAGAMPFFLTAIAKSRGFSRKENHETRAWQATLTGWQQRAHWAHQNSFEAFPLFAAAALTAHVAHPDSALLPILAWTFIAARVAYAACYLADLAELRSIVWFVGVGCCAGMFLSAL